MLRRLVPFLAVCLLPLSVSAEEGGAEDVGIVESSGPTVGVGFRVGGYGFREVNEGEKLSWDDCRMNGTGLFGTLDLGRHFFTELSADYYHATGNSEMDRTSFFPGAAVGARMLPGKLISPYIQAGGGPEFTRIDVGGLTAKKILPTAFMGIGGELNYKQFHFGSNLKVFTMGLPEHAHGVTEAHLEPAGVEGGPQPHDEPTDQVAIRHEVAGMAQFFVRYTF